MIRFSNVSKGYMTKEVGWISVLDNVNFVLPKNVSMGILGRNGAGKSTLIRLLSGLDIPDTGFIDTGNLRISWPLGGGVGMHGSLSGVENIRFIASIYNEDYHEIFDYVQKFAELGDYINIPVKTYSSGMKARLAFGISMALNFDTYLIDEGFSAGDASFRDKTKMIMDEKRKNTNVIVVSHNPKTIKQYSDIAGILHNGKLTMFEDVKEALNIYSKL